MSFEAKVIADSISAQGHRLTTLQVTFPRIILAEVNTHRVFCLAGDAELEFDLPAGSKGGKFRRVHKMRIDEFVDRWHNGAAPRLNKGGAGFSRQPVREKLACMQIRQLNEKTGLVQTSTVVDCVFSGVKEVFEITAGRFKVAGSKDHLVLTFDGWKTINDLTVGDLLVVRRFGKKEEDLLDEERLKKFGGRWRSVWQRQEREKRLAESGGCEQCGSQNELQIHHLEPVYKAPEKAFESSNVLLLCGECHGIAHEKQDWQGGTYLYGDTVPVTGIRLRGVEPTYDLSIAGEFPNFLANGVVVHNSRNSASSRAIPVAKRLEDIKKNPFIPAAFGKNQKGMQAGEALEDEANTSARNEWLEASKYACAFAANLSNIGVHKQWANRLIEFCSWHTAVITATEWDNWDALRDHAAASPEIQVMARQMKEARAASQPRFLLDNRQDPTSWHLPYVNLFEDWKPAVEYEKKTGISAVRSLRMISTGRCAAVSYERQEEKDFDKDLDRYKKLRTSGHMSPFEHPARPMTDFEYTDVFSQPLLEWNEERECWDHLGQVHYCGNYQGWVQERKMIPKEHNFALVRQE